ncbi:Hpt domain-containing protein [Pseudodesulfovibrio sp. zrk46]|uniref:Hpt domain-containing protein n=1 Tax=Pseudodesulfovibrio sp. zrk46 TaxID=2725288 RepID=UPI00144997EE|nr:Hpt domain-containing protein [Pseudodesulfovibrio sp. zrk46]QJB58072.1 Hpt domain-containing protein [Pseudodesulfovibrio sp. zrk46]
MTGSPFVEHIDPDLEELMEKFFDNSKKDVIKMQAALEAGDFETLARLGHTAKGTGYGYGFRGMGDIGLELEMAAKSEDRVQAKQVTEKMSYYLDNVRVEFGE